MKPELVFGIAGAVGTDLASVSNELRDALAAAGYEVEPIRVSELIAEKMFEGPLPVFEDERINRLMDGGNSLREKTKAQDAAARLALLALRRKRRERTGDSKTPAANTAYIIRSLKRREEVQALRDIYGSRFFLISAYSPRKSRITQLAKAIANSHSELDTDRYRTTAEQLVERDHSELNLRFGQRLSQTFSQGDVFVTAHDSDSLRRELRRFIRLIFGNPFDTPTRDEFGMFIAHASRLRSADLSRQVGACITDNTTGTVIATGTNEVPKAYGGQYWPRDPHDDRDVLRDVESGTQSRISIVQDLFQRLNDAGWFADNYTKLSSEALARTALFGDESDDSVTGDGILRASLVNAITEYSRSVHAEMAAITDSAMRGVPLKGSTLYTTTFPCHTCARHILSSGFGRVVFVEPYPKSLAGTLYPNDIGVEASEDERVRIPFEPYIGVSPHIYISIFEFDEGTRKYSDGRRSEWDIATAVPRFVRPDINDYLISEGESVVKLEEELQAAGLTT